MGTKNISLPADLEAYVDAKVESGEYAHASEVVRDAIRAMMREEAEKLEWLRNAVAEGVKSADDGPLISGKELVARVKRRGREMIEARKGAK
jgi:antitoxin ParD1/3/4